MDTIERIMQDTGMERLQAMRHLDQRAQLARHYADTQRQRARECVELYSARRASLVSKFCQVDGQPITPQPEVWRATLTRSRWLRAPLVIVTNANPSHGDALHDLRAMVATVTGRAFSMHFMRSGIAGGESRAGNIRASDAICRQSLTAMPSGRSCAGVN